MAKIIHSKNKVYIIGTNIDIKINRNKIDKILEHRLTGTTTVLTDIIKIVFDPKSEPMIFPK